MAVNGAPNHGGGDSGGPSLDCGPGGGGGEGGGTGDLTGGPGNDWGASSGTGDYWDWGMGWGWSGTSASYCQQCSLEHAAVMSNQQVYIHF